MIFIGNGGESVNQNIPISPPPLPPIKKTGSLLFIALFYLLINTGDYHCSLSLREFAIPPYRSHFLANLKS